MITRINLIVDDVVGMLAPPRLPTLDTIHVAKRAAGGTVTASGGHLRRPLADAAAVLWLAD
jgi:hypothetical protein